MKNDMKWIVGFETISSQNSNRAPSMAGARVSCWRSQKQAFPRQRATARQWKKCLVQELLTCIGFNLWSMNLLISRVIFTKSSDWPPSDPTTNEMKLTPIERQGCRWAVSFRWVPTSRAWPGVKPDFCTMDCWSGEITWISRAAGQPPCQVGERCRLVLTWILGSNHWFPCLAVAFGGEIPASGSTGSQPWTKPSKCVANL